MTGEAQTPSLLLEWFVAIVGEQLSLAQTYFISFRGTPVRGIVGSYSNSLFNSPGGTRVLSPIMAVLIYIPTINIQGFFLVIAILSS